MPASRAQRSRLLTALSGLALLTSAARAEVTPELRRLDLRQAVWTASQATPDVQAALWATLGARVDVDVARARYLPTLGVDGQASIAERRQRLGAPGATAQAIDSTGVEWNLSLSARVTAYDFGARAASVSQARAAEQASEARLALTRLSSARAAGELFVRVLTTERLARDAERNVQRQEAMLNAISRLIDAGLRPRADRQRAEIDAVAARYAVDVLTAQARTDRAALASALGYEPTLELALVPYAEALLSPPAPEAGLVALAERHRPELELSRAELQSRQANADRARAQLWPLVGASASASVDQSARWRGNGLAGHTLSATLGVFLTWQAVDPVAWRAQRSATIDAEVAGIELRGQALGVRTAVTLAARELTRVGALLEQARQVLGASLATAVTQRRRYEEGQASLIELLDAQSLEQQARARLIVAEQDVDLARLALLDASGVLLERLLGQ